MISEMMSATDLFGEFHLMSLSSKITTFLEIVLSEKTYHQKQNYLMAYMNYLLRVDHVHSFPIRLFVDPCNYCNLQCELCPTGRGESGRERGMMSFSLFKKIIDDCEGLVWEVRLFNWGEPLLNRELFDMVRYARSKKIDVTISTNMKHYSEDIETSIIRSGLNKIIVSLDGASQDSVNSYQKGNDFHAVLSHMTSLAAKRRSQGSDTPLIEWLYLINRHNAHEIDAARKIASDIGIDSLRFGKMRCDMGKEVFFTPDQKLDNLLDWLPEEQHSNHKKNKSKKSNVKACKSLWLESAVHPNGSVSPCCAVWPEKYDFGSIKESSFKDIWNNSKYRNARKISRGSACDDEGSDDICLICKKNEGLLY